MKNFKIIYLACLFHIPVNYFSFIELDRGWSRVGPPTGPFPFFAIYFVTESYILFDICLLLKVMGKVFIVYQTTVLNMEKKFNNRTTGQYEVDTKKFT